jgi:hypothetical protein
VKSEGEVVLGGSIVIQVVEYASSSLATNITRDELAGRGYKPTWLVRMCSSRWENRWESALLCVSEGVDEVADMDIDNTTGRSG